VTDIAIRCPVFKRAAHKGNLGLFIALIAMYILSTVHVACRWVLVKNAFIDHADTPTTTIVYLVQSPLWLTLLAAVSFTTNTLISDFVLVMISHTPRSDQLIIRQQIWRCWTIWNRNWRIVILPVLCTLVGAGN
jgi:hypothetical protein